MGEILEEVLAAQQDSRKADRLISKYLPFIKKQISGLQGMRLEYDDMLSLAMLTFYGCIRQYEERKGNFLSFCSVCIRNRLVDESRKQNRYAGKIIPLSGGEEGQSSDVEWVASAAAYQMAQERSELSQEIELFSEHLRRFGIDFEDLPRICPKQIRSRRLCMALAEAVMETPRMRSEFRENRRIPQTELAARFSVSPKTLEKHRKYIVALIVLMDGEYPYIQSFLPSAGEVI